MAQAVNVNTMSSDTIRLMAGELGKEPYLSIASIPSTHVLRCLNESQKDKECSVKISFVEPISVNSN